MWFNRFSAPILVLIWAAYYYAKRYTGGLADTADALLCGTVAFFSLILIIKRGIGLWKEKGRQE